MKVSIMAVLIMIVSMQLLHADNIIMTVKAENGIKSSVKAPKKIIPVDKKNLEKKKEKINAWITGSMDLKKAAKRESKRFLRTSYKSTVEKSSKRLLTERPDSYGVFRKQNKIGKAPSDPCSILYREGPMYFSFFKMTENRASTIIEKDAVVSLAKDFVLENKMLEETALDNIGSVEVSETRIDADGGSRKNDDYPVMQNVTFRRAFAGKPVVNSQVSLSIFPDTKEIVEMTNFNWPVLQEHKGYALSSSECKNMGIGSAEETGKKIKERINKVTGEYNQVIINSVEQGWFQDNDELIPVLIVKYDAELPTEEAPVKYLEVVNLTGDDEVFRKDFRPDYTPVEKPLGQ